MRMDVMQSFYLDEISHLHNAVKHHPGGAGFAILGNWYGG